MNILIKTEPRFSFSRLEDGGVILGEVTQAGNIDRKRSIPGYLGVLWEWQVAWTGLNVGRVRERALRRVVPRVLDTSQPHWELQGSFLRPLTQRCSGRARRHLMMARNQTCQAGTRYSSWSRHSNNWATPHGEAFFLAVFRTPTSTFKDYGTLSAGFTSHFLARATIRGEGRTHLGYNLSKLRA